MVNDVIVDEDRRLKRWGRWLLVCAFRRECQRMLPKIAKGTSTTPSFKKSYKSHHHNFILFCHFLYRRRYTTCACIVLACRWWYRCRIPSTRITAFGKNRRVAFTSRNHKPIILPPCRTRSVSGQLPHSSPILVILHIIPSPRSTIYVNRRRVRGGIETYYQCEVVIGALLEDAGVSYGVIAAIAPLKGVDTKY